MSSCESAAGDRDESVGMTRYVDDWTRIDSRARWEIEIG